MIRLACADRFCDGPKIEGKDDKNEKKKVSIINTAFAYV